MNRNKIIYSILKEIGEGNRDISQDTYEIERKEFGEIIDGLIDDEYIKKAYVKYAGYPSEPYIIEISQARLTEKGREYVKNNTLASKAYKTAKEIATWIK